MTLHLAIRRPVAARLPQPAMTPACLLVAKAIVNGRGTVMPSPEVAL